MKDEQKIWQDFRAALGELQDLRFAVELLAFDQQTAMPAAAGEGRARQIESLSAIAHERAISPRLGKLLDRVERLECAPDSAGDRLRRKARRQFERARAVPRKLAAAMAGAAGDGFNAWIKAREARDFGKFAPQLEKLIELNRRYADCFTGFDCAYDALLDGYEEGLRCRELNPLFDTLGAGLEHLLPRILEKQREFQLPAGKFPASRQLRLANQVAKTIGYDFARGGMALSQHPFSVTLGGDDMRVTTHVSPELPFSSLFSIVHECGHAMYEQGLPAEWARTPCFEGASFALHESQSRLWENFVARSRGFWRYFWPLYTRANPAWRDVVLDDFLTCINHVTPSEIRTEADEVTYNLHIILRYEIEQELIAGRLKVSELEACWNSRMQTLLGVTPRDVCCGVLQDVHWSGGDFGYFPTYALGNLIAAQFWALAQQANPAWEEEFAAGNFRNFRQFLADTLYGYGASLPPREIQRRIFGRDLPDPTVFLQAMTHRYLGN